MKRGEIVFMIVSLLTLTAGLLVFLEASSFQKKCNVTEGVVESWDMTFYYVRYVTDDGEVHIYKGTQGKNGKKHTGEVFRVFYMTDNHDKSRIGDGKRTGKGFMAFGAGLLLLTFVGIYQNRKKTRIANSFKEDGRKVQAEVTGIEVDTSITVLKKHPYKINLKWIDPISGKEYTDSIKQLWKDPAPYLKERNNVDVYIDRYDPNSYYLDTDFLADIKAY